MDHESERDLLEYVKKSTPSPFLLKTYMLVEDPNTDNIISWNTDGTAFIVWQTAEFSRDILPTLFKHSNFSSFVRQLNTYGFRKVTTNRWEFFNDMFQRGERELLCRIRRRKAQETKFFPCKPVKTTAQEAEDDGGSSSTSSSSGYTSLLNENKRLKRENRVLNSELESMKKKCNELLDLVSTCTEVDERPKLFGVRLGIPMKNKR